MSSFLNFVNRVNSLLMQLPGRNWLMTQAWEEFVAAFLPQDDWEELNVNAYDTHSRYLNRHNNLSIMFWELAAFNRYFPPTPAQILVTAAGGGREVNELLSRGYIVSAFEPGRNLAALCQEIAARNSNLCFKQLGYDEFLKDGAMPFDRHFDAVVIGWGSFSHLPDHNVMANLLRKLREICPHGPILLSWLPQQVIPRFRKNVSRCLQFFGGKPGNIYGRSSGLFHNLNTEEVRSLAADQGDKLLPLTKFNITEAAVLLHEIIEGQARIMI